MTQIAIAPSMTEYFEGVVDDAVRSRRVEISTAVRGYLVGMLCDFAHPDETVGSTMDQPLTFQLRDALDAVGAERFLRLRRLGDGVLYVAGFFGGHIELRGVDRAYVLGVGSTAYGQAASMLRLGGNGAVGFAAMAREREAGRRLVAAPDVLGELATKFDRVADVLADVAEGTLALGAYDDRTVLKLYDRWLKTGSSRLAGELAQRGLLPTKVAKGTN